MGFSAWKIWLHPQLSRRVFDELSAQAEESAANCARLEEEMRLLDEHKLLLEKTKLRIEEEKIRQEESLRDSEEKMRVLISEKEHLEADNRSLREELENRRDTEIQIEEFNKKLDGFAAVKENYEKRVTRLREEILRLRTLLQRQDPEESELTEIDMTSGSTVVSKAISKAKPIKRKPESSSDDSDWLNVKPPV